MNSEAKEPTLPYDPYAYQSFGSQYDNRVGLVKELSPRNALITATDEIRGEIKDPDSGRVLRRVEPLMNEKGIAIFFHAVTAGANDINTMSNYSRDYKLIYSLMMKWVTDMVYEFYINRKTYGIVEETHCSIIINKAVGLILPSFFKALGAGDRRAATASVSEMIQRAFKDNGSQFPSVESSKKGGGVLSRLNPFS